MIRLGINVDHVATLRQARGESYPSPVQAAVLAELGGADNITCHLREDRRHIQDRDVFALRETITGPLNLEIGATDEMLAIAERVRPHSVTLVPERREELTTEGGLDLHAQKSRISDAVSRLKESRILVALFVEPDIAAIEIAAAMGADCVEIHTGSFCRSIDRSQSTAEKVSLLHELRQAARRTQELSMQTHFGHGLNYGNTNWLQLIPEAEEANIGHSVMARAVFVGLEKAVRQMKDLLNQPSSRPHVTSVGAE